MKVPEATPIVMIRAEVLVATCDADAVIREFHDLFCNSDAAQYRTGAPDVVEIVDDVSEDAYATLYPEVVV